MKVPMIVKLAVFAGACAVVYVKVLNDDARRTVREAAQEVIDNVQSTVSKVSGMRPIDMKEDASAAQAWAAEQWVNIGFGAEK